MKKIKITYKHYVALALTTLLFYLSITTGCADQDNLISLFPIEHYDQTIATWLKPNDPNYDQPLLTRDSQQKRLDIFYNHYFGSVSPWNVEYVSQILKQAAPNDLKAVEQSLISTYSNENKSDSEIGYGENFRPHTEAWINNIANNINLSQLSNLTYQISNRGIATQNLLARILPTTDVHFYSYKLAGQGYPFDNLQISSLWAGTPVYILASTQDHAWDLVVTPDYIAWVKSEGIAHADNLFVDLWSAAAKKKLVAITHTQTSLVDQSGHFLLSAYIGSVFPLGTSANQILVPVADENNKAIIKDVIVRSDYIATMPLTATRHNFANVMSTMIGRPYGWGNSYFYNDCSAELKNLFTPFGIWLPRHSSDQMSAGKMVDMSALPQEQRLASLMTTGQPLLTLIYIGGHVILYVGNYPNPNDNNNPMAMTYQDVWGLSPNPPTRRAVIGGSVLFPMLLQYPEDTSLVSLANKKYFQVAYLDQLPTSDAFLREITVDLRSLMGLGDR